MNKIGPFISAVILLASSVDAGAEDLHERVQHGYADSGGVRIHYATLGKGPLVVMIHGFPDYWYTWRHQMAALEDSHQVVAIDLRGYNRSGKPAGVDQYKMPLLVADVRAVITHLKKEKAIIVGHDWGGAVAWSFAMSHPKVCDKLIILNLPHPWGLGRELANNPVTSRSPAPMRSSQPGGSRDGSKTRLRKKNIGKLSSVRISSRC